MRSEFTATKKTIKKDDAESFFRRSIDLKNRVYRREK